MYNQIYSIGEDFIKAVEQQAEIKILNEKFTVKRARALCFILSLIETAKQNGIAPEDYLRCLF